MGKASDLTNTDTSNYWLYPANSITLTCPESSFISNVPGQQRSATRSASIMQYLPLLSGGKPSDPATDGVPSPAAQWQCMGSRCACKWGGSQSEFRDCCSKHSVMTLSCTYIEFQTYQTCLAGPLDFDTMRFNWRMTFLHSCLSILSHWRYTPGVSLSAYLTFSTTHHLKCMNHACLLPSTQLASKRVARWFILAAL